MMKLVCCLATVLVLAACGGSAAPSLSAPPAESSKASPAASAAAQPVTAVDAAPSAAKFTVPYTAFSGAFAALWVAADEGFFAKHGFDVNVQYMDANVAASALISGEVPFAVTPAIVNTILSGGDAVIVAKLVTLPKFSLYAGKDVSRIEDLRGKVLADTQRGSAPDTAMRDMLAKHGLKEGDVQFAYLPNPTAALAAMVAGQASAAVLPAPTTVQARSQGFKEIANTVSENVPGLASPVSTRRSRLKDNPANVKEYLTALKEATAFMKANPARTKITIGKYAKTDVAAEMEETYNAYEATWVTAAVRPEDIAASLRYSSDPRAATSKPEIFFDNSIVETL